MLSEEQPTVLGHCTICNLLLYRLSNGDIVAERNKPCYPGESHTYSESSKFASSGKPKYEQVWNIQTAINTAVAEGRVVRFLSDKSNKELKKEVEDLKGCKLLKPSKESCDVAVVPGGIENFDFEEVNTRIVLPRLII